MQQVTHLWTDLMIRQNQPMASYGCTTRRSSKRRRRFSPKRTPSRSLPTPRPMAAGSPCCSIRGGSGCTMWKTAGNSPAASAARGRSRPSSCAAGRPTRSVSKSSSLSNVFCYFVNLALIQDFLFQSSARASSRRRTRGQAPSTTWPGCRESATTAAAVALSG